MILLVNRQCTLYWVGQEFVQVFPYDVTGLFCQPNVVDTRKCVTNVCNSGCPFPLVAEVTTSCAVLLNCVCETAP